MNTGKCILIIISLVFLISGCATLKKEDCLTADWFQIGFEDGARGLPADRIGKHRKACSKHDVTPNLSAYLDGRDQGLTQYCTPHNGYRRGLTGKSYKGLCRKDLEGPFLDAYNKGRDVYYFKQDISRQERKLKNIEDQLAQVDEQITQKELALGKGCADPKLCRRILDEIRGLDDEKNRLLFDIDDKQDLIRDMKLTLSDMMNQNRY